MRLTPLDIREQQFRRVMRGLDPEEVSAFLANVSEEYEALLSENKELRDRVLDFEEKLSEYRNMEKALRDTLLTAERVMTESKESAQREASLIVREAELSAQRATSRIGQDILDMRKQLAELRKVKDGYLARVRWLMRSQLEMIEVYAKDFSEVDSDVARHTRDVAADGPGAGAAPQGGDAPGQPERAAEGVDESGGSRTPSRAQAAGPSRASAGRAAAPRSEAPEAGLDASASPTASAGTAALTEQGPSAPRYTVEKWSLSDSATSRGDEAPRESASAPSDEAAYDVGARPSNASKTTKSSKPSRSRAESKRRAPSQEPEAPQRAGSRPPGTDEVGWSVNPEMAMQAPGKSPKVGDSSWSMQQFRDLLPDSESKT